MKVGYKEKSMFKVNSAIIFVILITISLFFLTGCSDYEYKNIISQQKEADETEELKVYEIKEPFIFNDLEYTVLSVEESKEYNGHETENIFVVVTINVENKGKTPATITNDYFILIDENDCIYESDAIRDISFKDDNYFSITDDINPGLSKKGRVSFEVPEGLNVLILGVRDNMFDFGGANYRYVVLKDE